MKPEELLSAIGGVNDEAIRDARFGKPVQHRHPVRRMVAIALAAVLLFAMGATVGAYVGAGDWFLDFFDSYKQHLNQGQRQVIRDSAVDIGESMTCSGYTLTLESVLADEQRMYAKLLIEGPEDVDLKTARCDMWWSFFYTEDGIEYPLISLGSVDEKYTDRMGEPNVLTIVFEGFLNFPEENEEDLQPVSCGLRINNLSFSSVLSKGDWAVKGEWEFSFDLSELEAPRELLQEPLYVTVGDVDCSWSGKDYNGKTWTTKVLSIKLSPLGGIVVYDHQGQEELWLGYFRAVRYDGSALILQSNGGSWSHDANEAEWYFSCPQPLDLDAIEYLEFEDGTKVFVH